MNLLGVIDDFWKRSINLKRLRLYEMPGATKVAKEIALEPIVDPTPDKPWVLDQCPEVSLPPQRFPGHLDSFVRSPTKKPARKRKASSRKKGVEKKRRLNDVSSGEGSVLGAIGIHRDGDPADGDYGLNLDD